VQARLFVAVGILCGATAALVSGQAQPVKDLDELFAPDRAAGFWRQSHCDLYPMGNGVLWLGLHEGCENHRN
jgi:hypothetical protein